MDPNTVLNSIADALYARNINAALEHAKTLTTWLIKGGFAPNWKACRIASRWFINRTKPTLRNKILIALNA